MSRTAKVTLTGAVFANDLMPVAGAAATGGSGGGGGSSRREGSAGSTHSSSSWRDFREPMLDLPPLGPGSAAGKPGVSSIAPTPISTMKKPTLLDRRRSKGGMGLSVVSGLGLSMDTLHENTRDQPVAPDEPPRALSRGWSTTVTADAAPSPLAPCEIAAAGGRADLPAATPSRRGRAVRTVVAAPVFPGSAVKVVNYNILADRLTTTDRYPHCPPAALGEPYRINLIKEELRQTGADIIVLTEISVAVFEGGDSLGGFLRDTLHYSGNLAVITDKKGELRCERPPPPVRAPTPPTDDGRRGSVDLPALQRKGSDASPLSRVPSVRAAAAAAATAGGASSGDEGDGERGMRRTEMDGVAIFYDASRFELLESTPLHFNRFAAKDTLLTEMERKKLQVDSHNVALISVLRDLRRPTDIYVVGAVHLIWQREESQMYQSHLLLLAMEILKRRYTGQTVGVTLPPTPVKTAASLPSSSAAGTGSLEALRRAAAAASEARTMEVFASSASSVATTCVRCVIAGDFNAEMDSNVVRYITTGTIPEGAATMACWKDGNASDAAGSMRCLIADALAKSSAAAAAAAVVNDASLSSLRIDRRATRAPAPMAMALAAPPALVTPPALTTTGDGSPLATPRPVSPVCDNTAFAGRRGLGGAFPTVPPTPELAAAAMSTDSLIVSVSSLSESEVPPPPRRVKRGPRASLSKADCSMSDRFADPSADELTSSHSILSLDRCLADSRAVQFMPTSPSDGSVHAGSDEGEVEAGDSASSRRRSMPETASRATGPTSPKPPTRYFRPHNCSPRFKSRNKAKLAPRSTQRKSLNSRSDLSRRSSLPSGTSPSNSLVPSVEPPSPSQITALRIAAFAHRLRFQSSYEVYCRKHPRLVSAVNPSTNAEGKVLDHILFEPEGAQCLGVLRLGEHVELPTINIPSDHYPVGAVLAFSAPATASSSLSGPSPPAFGTAAPTTAHHNNSSVNKKVVSSSKV